MVSWETKATCPPAALSLHNQPTKTAFTLFLLPSLWRSFTPSICHRSWRHVLWIDLSGETSYSVWKTERVRTCLLNSRAFEWEKQNKALKSSNLHCDNVFMQFVCLNVLSIPIIPSLFCLCAFIYFTLRVWKRTKNWKRVRPLHSNKDCKEASGLLSQFKSDQNLKSTMLSRRSPPPMNCQSPARDLLVCHTSFSLLIWLNIVDILLIVFRSSVLNIVRHSRKSSFFYFIPKSLVV